MTSHLIHSLRSLRLGLVLVFTLLMAATSLAEDVINIEAMGQTINKETTWENCSVNIIGNGTVTFSRRIYIRGSVTLNLGAQTTLDAQNGIGVHDGHSLTITGEGNLNTRSGSSNENSPLGGSKGNGIANAGSITILGGNITAINTGSLSYYFGAAIGGAELGSGGNITIRGGTVNAISDSGSRGCKGAGIGGGFNGNAGTITITGGVVKATSGTYGAAAIGGGTINESGKGKGGSITISGGQVTAVSLRGNGIGPGRDGSTREGTAGTISLSWTESTDFINANSYRGDISIEGDSRFYYEGSTDLVLADELAKRQNQKIIPVELDNNSIALANLQMQDYSILPNGAIKYLNYDVYDYNGDKLIKGTHYTETVRYSVDATGAMEEGKLMLTIKGKSPYFGSQSFIMWVNTAVLTQDGDEKYVTIPEKRKMTLKITESEIKDGLTSFKVYEAGGKNHVLGKEWDGVLVINIPDNSNYLIQLSGKALAADRTSKNDLIDCELIYEGYLTVYDNDEASGTILLENSELIYDYLPNPVAVIPTITSTGKNLAIRYREMYGYSDLDLSVTLVPADRKYNVNLPDRFTGGQVTANLRQAKANDNITLTVTPDEGYMLNELRVVKADGEAVNVTDCNWYTDWSETISKTVTFKMPTQNVTVAAVFTNKLNSDEEGLYVNMPHSGTKNMVIPDNITSFKLYDDGGKDGDFQPLSDGILAITAPSGKVMQFSGKSFMVDNSSSESYYAIYNDPPKSYGQKLAYGNQQKEETLYPVVSEGNTAYVRLKAADISRTDFFHKYGLDLNVKVFTPAVYSVSSDKNMEHGNVMFDKTQVVTNGTINVTVSSDEGYVLKDIDAFDADGKIVMTKPDTVQWGDAVYYAASTGYSFKMRSSDATVTATFMPKTDFFVNMPKTGQRDIIIQDDMTSFRVYDNSGKDGFYFTNDDGKLLLTAPEDCMMKVSGYVKLMYTSAEEDYLDIYNGNSTNAKRLGRFRGYKNSSTTSVTASSSTNQMLLHFISNGYGYVKDGGGVYLTVSVIKRFTSSDITVAAIEDQTYTGSRICPAISVTDGEKVLEPGVDFTTQCSNNISVGTASMTITGKGHYTGEISKQFKIAKAPLMIIAKDKSIIYGDKPANAGVEYAGFLGGDKENSLSGSIVFSYDYTQYDKVGEYAIMPSGLESNNYEIEFVAGKLTVGPKEISIAWDDKETSFTYNGKAQAPNATAGGLLNNDECNIIIDSVMNVGKYSAEAIDLTNVNYKLPENRDGPDFEITKAPLTVSAKNATIAYGDEPSNAGVEYSGFVGDDNENDLNDSIVFNYDYVQFYKVGKYVIIPGGLSSDNYDITFVEGELTVEPKEISIVWSDASFTYNGSEQIPMATANGVENSDECIFTVTGAATNVGKYTAKVTDLSNENYKLPATGLEQAFEITKAPLKITALNDTIVYGDEPASAGIAYDGFVGKETSNVLTGELAFEINYKQYGDVGEFAITPSGLANDNYEIEFAAGRLTVEPKVVSIAWDDETSFTYDGKAHAPNATAEGLVNNDECNFVIDSATNAGKYTAKVTDLSNKNYKLPATGLEQSFEIAKIPLTVTAKNATIVYGDEPSNAGVEYSGFVVTDNEKSLKGSLVYSYDYKQYGDAGEYAITPSGLTADNYEIEFVAGKLTVEPKEVSVAWGKSSFIYNSLAQVPAATAEGLVNSDKCGLTVAGAATNAGKYTATVTGLNNKNYKLPATGLEQAFEITKANPTIVKSPVAVENLVYNGKAQTLVTAGEAKNGTLVYKLASEEKYSEALPTATNGGDYTVYFMVLGNANYNDLEAQTLTASIKVPVSSSSSSIPASSSSAIASSSSVAESSSSSVIASSSSSAPSSSSSAVKPSSSSVIASSSSSAPSSSSCAVKPSSSSVIVSSSSSAPASSSSAVKPSSSSSDSTTPVNMTTLASAFRVVYARNELVVTNSVASELKVSVFDVQGNLKMQYRGSTAGNHSISLKQCVPGIYLVRVESSGKVQMLQVHVK
ncbi:MAG: T9SS type A sorting domain-containing protein [Fibrobacter sp.]|uniref:MBG domain-containing protein n=1 Tax=Fibrobacter sp. TaxID=35828 RepID=UPI0025BBCA4F|nr:MBG domain-containing protein [Fibrobacter sp.]MBQ7079980.1 T9SS type A sorting domain-containing protein [Fibrobacter sp.]